MTPTAAGLLAAAEAAGWPALHAGRLRVRAGELAWRQAVTLATPAEAARLADVLNRPRHPAGPQPAPAGAEYGGTHP